MTRRFEPTGDVKSAHLAKLLSKHISGEVRFDDMMRVLYSTDASHYQVYPIGVVLPKTNEDIQTAVQLCAEHGVPMVPRGGGSGLCGQAIGPGVVIDPTKYMTRVLEIDTQRGEARVQAGAVLGMVNKQLAQHGWQFGPDPASAERATIGGIIGTNATGAHSIRYGMTSDNVTALRCVLANELVVELDGLFRGGAEARRDEDKNISASSLLCTSAKRIIETHREAIYRDFPKVWRRASGYNVDYLSPWWFHRLLARETDSIDLHSQTYSGTPARPAKSPYFASTSLSLTTELDFIIVKASTIELVVEWKPNRSKQTVAAMAPATRSNPTSSLVTQRLTAKSPYRGIHRFYRWRTRVARHGGFVSGVSTDLSSTSRGRGDALVGRSSRLGGGDGKPDLGANQAALL